MLIRRPLLHSPQPSQENLAYVEYDPAFTFNVTDPSGSGLQHYELYDVDKDPYQMHNLYSTTDAATRTRLHGMLGELGRGEQKHRSQSPPHKTDTPPPQRTTSSAAALRRRPQTAHKHLIGQRARRVFCSAV